MIVPKPFQQIYIDNLLDLMRGAKSLYDEAENDDRRIYSYNGASLLKAPTGSGKTLIAGTVCEKFAFEEKIVWFWFAPFKGLVGQAAASLRDHHPGLRVRDLATDRKVNGTRSGDTFVLTWASVVATSADARKLRKDNEQLPSLDGFLAGLRRRGFRIGVIIDEAHHGLGSETRSVEFFREVLVPDYSLMITATPDDADADKFTQAARIVDLHRVTVSREEAVEAGLIKPAVRSIAYISPPDQAALADFEAAALHDAVTMHGKIKAGLLEQGISLVPLLLVQANSDENIAEIRASLLKLGFPESAVSVHTAKEPDESFLAMAVNESKEVLIFKLAAALGFDAPRAFCMVSLRKIRDTDFGTQLVGRIMRVHKRLQGRNLPPLLQHGYLFLADHESQQGITAAAEKINRLKSQLSQTSPFTMLTRVGGSTRVQIIRNNQPDLLEDEPEEIVLEKLPVLPPVPVGPHQTQDILDLLSGMIPSPKPINPEDEASVEVTGFRYALRPGSPTHFLTQELPLEVNDLLACMEQQIGFNDAALLAALAKDVQIIRIDRGHFENIKEDERSIIHARIDLEKAGQEAQQLLLRQQYLSPRDLQNHLLKRLATEFRSHGMADVADDEDRLETALDLILVRHPGLLREVEKSCSARFAITRDADLLPGYVDSTFSLQPSFKNIYGIYPADLNPWEIEFARLLDNDPGGHILWWHRNPVKKRYSVCIVRPDGGRYFPDFVVGIKGRTISRDGILLIETKHAIGSLDSQIKATVEHKAYGKALMIHWKDWTDPKRRTAMTVSYDPRSDKNLLDAVFRCASAPSY